MKERIYIAALHGILQRGLRFSVRDLASQLGISTKTVYMHFESKEKIISYIVDRSIQEMKETEEKMMTDSTLSLKEKLHRALVNIPQGVAFNNIRVLHDLKRMYPEQWRTVDEHLNHGWDHIRLLMKAGIDQKELRPFDIELFIRVYVGALYSVMDEPMKNNHHLSLEAALSETVNFLLFGIYNHQNES